MAVSLLRSLDRCPNASLGLPRVCVYADRWPFGDLVARRMNCSAQFMRRATKPKKKPFMLGHSTDRAAHEDLPDGS